MAKLYDYININEIKEKFGIKIFVETGTSDGNQFFDYLKFNFNDYYSCEINKEQYDVAYQNIGHINNIHLSNQSSFDFFSELLPKIKDIPTVFWLDAHFPGSEIGLPLTYEKDKKIRTPLEDEIYLISKLKNTKNDIIVCDDLKIYEDNNYDVGTWNLRKDLGYNDINFIYKNFYKTHNIIKKFDHDGCVIIIPRKINNYHINVTNDHFTDLVNDIINNIKIQEIIETGTFDGNGSTKTLAKTNISLKTIECNTDNFNRAKINLQNYSNIEFINAFTLNRSDMIKFIKNDFFLYNKEYLNDCQIMTDHDNPEIFYIGELNNNSSIEENVLFDLINNDKKQIIFLDSAGGVGYLEFLEVMKLNKEFLVNKHIILDDIFHVKHFRSYEYLILNNIKFKIIDNRLLYFNYES